MTNFNHNSFLNYAEREIRETERYERRERLYQIALDKAYDEVEFTKLEKRCMGTLGILTALGFSATIGAGLIESPDAFKTAGNVTLTLACSTVASVLISIITHGSRVKRLAEKYFSECG